MENTRQMEVLYSKKGSWRTFVVVSKIIPHIGIAGMKTKLVALQN